jgi:uncharacterized protein YbaR (Trm112 family)
MDVAAHRLFWPFDFGRSPAALVSRPRLHLPDLLRVGAIAGHEGWRLRLQAHLMACPFCREGCLQLWRQVPVQGEAGQGQGPCPKHRAALFRFLELGRHPGRDALAHLVTCPTCHDDFVGPARALSVRELDEAAIAAQD